MEWRILLSDYLPDYLHDHGVTGAGRILDEVGANARISEGTAG